ncbi:MAG: dephospho-CoA kinase [Chitinophagales bacterium]|jgi:dephospho-CoA kinase|nr:dephospho-CoA kinase [Chitinophagales bacterium]
MKIGITGMIGSGKSYLLNYFGEKGFATFSADEVAKQIIHQDQAVKNKLKKVFSELAYVDDAYNVDFVRKVVLKNKYLLSRLNAIVHPAFYQVFDDFVLHHKQPIFVESALMVSTGFYQKLDAIIWVQADRKTIIDRVLKRNTMTQVEIEKVIAIQERQVKQLSKVPHFIFSNNNEIEFKENMLRLHTFLGL